MAALSCEICGGKLIGKPGGIFECDSCGIEYNTEWAKAKIQEIKGTVKVEGTVEVTGTVKLDGPVEVVGGTNKENLVKRAKMKLEDAVIPQGGRWWLPKESEYHSIKALLEQALEIDPEYDEALLYMTLNNHGCRTPEEFRTKYVSEQKESKAFQRFRQFAKGDLAVLAEEIQREFDAKTARVKQKRLQERLQEEQERLQEEQERLKKEEEERITYELNKKKILLAREKLSLAQGVLAAGNEHTIGLRVDGTVAAVGSNLHGQCNVSEWRDIVAVAAGNYHTIGLRGDGTVVAVGNNAINRCNVSEWRDIVAVAAGVSHTVGLRGDGTVVAVGGNSDGQCDASEWQLFNSIETLEQDRKEAKRIEAERKAKQKTALEDEKAALSAELANLKGLFTGKRRKEIEARLAEIDTELKNL